MRPAIETGEQSSELLLHPRGIFPIVSGASLFFGARADKRLALNAGDIGGVGANQETVWPLRGVQGNGGSGENQEPKHRFVFCGGAVAPMNAIGLAHLGYFFDPALEFGVPVPLRCCRCFHNSSGHFECFSLEPVYKPRNGACASYPCGGPSPTGTAFYCLSVVNIIPARGHRGWFPHGYVKRLRTEFHGSADACVVVGGRSEPLQLHN